MSDTIKDSFIGGNKVLLVAESTKKTPMGADMVEISYEGGAKEIMPKKTYKAVVTDIPTNYTILQETKLKVIAPAVVAVIEEFDLKVSDIQALMQKIASQIDNRFSRATNFALTHDDSQYIPNMNPLYNRSLLEVEAIISTIPSTVEKPKTDETTPTGTDQGAAGSTVAA